MWDPSVCNALKSMQSAHQNQPNCVVKIICGPDKNIIRNEFNEFLLSFGICFCCLSIRTHRSNLHTELNVNLRHETIFDLRSEVGTGVVDITTVLQRCSLVNRAHRESALTSAH